MTAYDPDELNRSEQSAGNNSSGPKWSGDDANYNTKWGGDYGSDNVNQAEKAAASQHEDAFLGGYKPGAEDQDKTWRSRLFRGRRRKAAIGTAIVALIIAAIAAVIIGILPLKILHMVNNLQARFYATAENAVEMQTERLFSNYIRGKIMSSLAGCRGVYIDHNCNPYDGSSLVKKLYRGWSDGRLEEKLRQQAGIEIRKNQVSQRFEMRFSGGDRLDIEDLRQNKTLSQLIDAKGDWTEVKKSQVKGVYKTALKGATRHASAMYYLKVTPYLAKKVGIRWCVIGCDKKQDYDKWKADKKFGAKMWMAERVLGPRFELYSMIMRCLYASDAFCNRNNVIDSVRDSENARPYSATAEGCNQGCSDNGRHVSTSLNEMEAKLVALAASFGSDRDSLRRAFDRFEKNGFISAVINNLINDKVNDAGDSEGRNKLEHNQEAMDRAEAEAQRQGFGPKSAVRVLGWVVTWAYIIEFLDQAPDVATRLQYMANSTAMTQMWAMYRSVADEAKEGETDAELYGSFWSSFNPGMQPTEGGGGQIGGTAGAEQTPLYTFAVNQKKPSAASIARPANAPPLCSETGNDRYFLDESESTTENYYWGADPGPPVFNDPSANRNNGIVVVTHPDGRYAVQWASGETHTFPALDDYCDPGDGSAFEPASSSTYRCKNNRPPSASKIVCREMVLNDKQGNIQKLKALQKIPLWNSLAGGAKNITSIVNRIVSKIFDWIFKIPYTEAILSALGGEIAKLVTAIADYTELDRPLRWFATWLLGDSLNLVTNNMSGGRTFDLVAGGADVSGNDFAHNGIGGVALTPEQLAANLDYYQQRSLAEYRQKPLLAQITDTESTYSPISKIALAIPANRTAVVNSLSDSFASLVKNPLGKLFSNFASIFTPKSLAASYPTGKSPFGITQYGYPLDDPIFNEDPDEYWQKYCTDSSPYNLTKTWNQYAADNLNPNTFEPENAQTTAFQSSVPGNKYGTNGCLLIQTAVAAAGGTFTDDVLSAEELAEYSSGNGDGGGGTVLSDARELARQILNNRNIDLSASNFCRYCLEDIRNTAEGRPAYGNVRLDINLLSFLAELGQQTRVDVNSITGEGTGHENIPPSRHYSGLAIDLGCNGISGDLLDRIGQKYSVRSNTERCDTGDNHWHYSTSGD